MALTSTIYTFDIELSDTDRGVYETLALRVARHPSQSEEFLVTRVLAYCLEYTEGLAFSNGLSDPDEPALFAALVASLQRRMRFALAVTSGHLYITLGERMLDGAVQRYAWQGSDA